MFKLLIFALIVSAVNCRPNTSEDIAQDLTAFKNNLKSKYDEAQNVGNQGLDNFLNYLQQQKQQLDEHYERLKQQGEVTDDVKQRAEELKQYLQQLSEQAVDEARGWTEQAANRAKELVESLKQYENHRVTPEDHVAQIQSFQNNIQQKYEEVKNNGQNNYNTFLEYLQNEKARLDQHYEQLKNDHGAVDESVKQQAKELRDYIHELTRQTVDDSKGWTQSAIDKVKEIWESLKDYEQWQQDRIVGKWDETKANIQNAYSSTPAQ